ncbi:hypothetical protein PAPYR_7486 [Paratrimastix pyriformis]|uniref:Uncharacterized protein n=1 Tax=Paratrimastix pyriformis TaxID=342808 RepID=A0ABQ8UCV2_9EUKA|nr:hypothetical protein PAPYR_7486 [Paratrimastix pyriformis]
MFVGGTKIHTGGGGVLIQLARWTLPRVLTFVNAPFCRFQMNSIDWNQFHTPQEAIEYCEGAIGQDPPKWAEGYQAINWSPAPPPRTPHQERPCPDPYRPEGPDRPDPARPTTPASGAVEHKDKGTGAARPILDDDDVPSPPKPKKAAPAAAKPKKDREAPKKARRPRWPPSPRRRPPRRRRPRPRPPARRKPGPPHEAKEAAEAKGSDDAPRRTPGRGTGTSTRPQWRSPPRRRTRAAVPRTQGEGRAQAGPADRPGRLLPEAARQVLQSVVDLVNAYLARHPPPPTPLAK